MADRTARSAKLPDAGNKDQLTPAAFAARFNSVWRALWCIAEGVLGDRAGADDVLQEAAMIALGKLSQFDPDSNFMAWMGSIVRFTALNHARRRMRVSTVSVDPHGLDFVALNRVERSSVILTGRGQLFAGQEQFDDRVLAALQTLDETARACLLLRTILEMPYREISLALDIAEGTAMSHVHRARTSLREKLTPAHPHATTHLENPAHGHE